MYNERASRRQCLERLAGDVTLRTAFEATLTRIQIAGKYNRVPTYEMETFIRKWQSPPVTPVTIDTSGFEEP